MHGDASSHFRPLARLHSTQAGLHFDQGSENGIPKAIAIPSLKSVTKDDYVTKKNEYKH